MRVYDPYCIGSNHFQILVEVPQRPANGDLPDEAELVHRVRDRLGGKLANGLEWGLSHHGGEGHPSAAEVLRQKWFARMGDVSALRKVLKQRFCLRAKSDHAKWSHLLRCF